MTRPMHLQRVNNAIIHILSPIFRCNGQEQATTAHTKSTKGRALRTQLEAKTAWKKASTASGIKTSGHDRLGTVTLCEMHIYLPTHSRWIFLLQVALPSSPCSWERPWLQERSTYSRIGRSSLSHLLPSRRKDLGQCIAPTQDAVMDLLLTTCILLFYLLFQALRHQ